MTPAASPLQAPPASPAVEAGVRRKPGGHFELELRQVAETEKTAGGKHRWLITTL